MNGLKPQFTGPNHPPCYQASRAVFTAAHPNNTLAPTPVVPGELPQVHVTRL